MTNIPAWIGAIGTVGTLTTGLVIFAGTMSDRRREYSKLIAVWTDVKTLEKGALKHEIVTATGDIIKSEVNIEDMSNLQGPFEVSLKLKNSSLQAVYACKLRATLDKHQQPTGAWAIWYNVLNLELGIVAPEEEVTRILLVGAPHVGVNFGEFLARAFAFDLQFTDAAGRSWTRNQTGRLTLAHRNRKSLLRITTSAAQRNNANPDSAGAGKQS
jgi:hypothetical protein